MKDEELLLRNICSQIPSFPFGASSFRAAETLQVRLIISHSAKRGQIRHLMREAKINPRKYGKGGEFASNRLDDQEISMLALHLLQISLVFVNTLMVQEVLAEGEWMKRLTTEDYRGLTPLFYGHINPYGILRLDMTERLPIREAAS